MLARYLESCYASKRGVELKLPTYDEFVAGLTEPGSAETQNWRGFISNKSVVRYWEESVRPRADGWRLRPNRGTSIDALVEAVDRTCMPVVVSYIMPYENAAFLNFIRTPARLLTLGFSENAYKNRLPFEKDDEIVLHGYLHASLCIGFSREEGNPGSLEIYLADPWTGRLVAWDASEFEQHWTDYDTADSSDFYRSRIKDRFEFLASPGSFLTLEDD